MKAVVFLGEREMEIRDYPDPVPGPDEVVLAIKASGMCGSDLHYYRGKRRREDEIVIEGHEPCGVVVEVGNAVRPIEAKIGDRVMVHHYDGCRVCSHCRSGWTQLCASEYRVVFGALRGDGAHAKYMKVPAHTLIKMPDQLSFKSGAAISCGTGTAYGAIKKVQLASDETVAVFGQGPVGLSCTMMAKAAGACVIALDISDERLELARSFGADITINPLRDHPLSAIRDITRRGEGADKSIECSSNPVARRQSVECLRSRGIACLVGGYGTIEFEVQDVIQFGKSVLGSVTFSKNMQDDCANYVVERGLDVDALFTNSFAIEQAREAYELFDEQKIGKGVFLFD